MAATDLAELGAEDDARAKALRDVHAYGRWQGIRRTSVTMMLMTLAVLVNERAAANGTDTAWDSDLIRWLGLLLTLLILRFATLLTFRAREARREWARAAGILAGVLAVGLLVLHVWAEATDSPDQIAVAGWVALGVEVAVLVLGCVVLVSRPAQLTGRVEVVRDTDLTVPTLPEVDENGSAICLSGGGIRAAAFGLGGVQALTASETVYRSVRRIYAVSGGSYLAASLATLSSPPAPEGPVDPAAEPRPAARPDHAQRPFQRASAEESRLRRNTFYLIGSPSAAVVGLLHILYGLILNLTLVLSVMYVIAWWAGTTFGNLKLLSRLFPTTAKQAPDRLYQFGDVWPNFSWWFTGPMLGLVGFVFFAFAAARFLETVRRPANPTSTRLQNAAGATAVLAAVFAVVAFAVPLLIAGLSNLTVENRPTVQVARVLFAVNAADRGACEAGLQQHLVAARAKAVRQNDDEGTTKPREFTYGACGTGYTSRTVPVTTTPNPQAYPEASDDLKGTQLSAEGDSSHVGGVAAFLAAVAALIQSLFRSPEKGSSAPWYQRLWGKISGVVLPWLAITMVALIALLTLLVWTRMFAAAAEGADRNPPLVPEIRIPVLDDPVAGFFVVLVALLVVYLLMDANRGSLYPFYRERLSKAFLVERRDHEQGETWSRAMNLTDRQVGSIDVSGPVTFDRYPGAPEVMICASANAEDRGLIPPQRGCVPFVFSRTWMGVSDDSLPIPPRLFTSQRYAQFEPDDTTLGAAIAISGAAFSPLMGRMSRRATAFRVLLALGNARLGVWLHNPYWIDDDQDPPSRFRRFLGRPGIFRLVVEAVGRPSLLDGRLYVTDGGHFDNIALVEALRPKRLPEPTSTGELWERMPARIYVLDASADSENTFDAISDAVATVRMDLGLSVEVPNTAALESTPDPGGKGTDLAKEAWIKAPVRNRFGIDTGITVYFGKAIAFEHMSRDLRTYLGHHPEYPRTATTNQLYGEFDFEAYRQLGQLVGEGMLRSDLPRVQEPAD